MKTILALILCTFAFTGCVAKTLTPDLQATVDGQRTSIASLAADPVIVAAAKAQNAKGPVPGWTNSKWEDLSPNDPAVRAFQENSAGGLLTTRVKSSNGKLISASLSGAKGEKIAFTSKTPNYLLAGHDKFERPMAGETYVAKPRWDYSAGEYAVPVCVPVMDGGKPIGVLIVGVGAEKQGGFVWPWDWTWTREDWD